ncbi:MAG: hypothetical protein AAGF11_40070 [Myxococcota bacterium]
MTLPVKSDALLRKRIRRFFRDKPALLELISKLETIAPVAVFGGLLRDASVFGMRKFTSDIDLVIEREDDSQFHHLLHDIEHSINRFGGYRLIVGGWCVDLWPLGTTWAIKQGLVVGSNLDVLPKTTFFSCDAIAFDLTRRVLYQSNHYRHWVDERFLDINLLDNPNYLGSTVRALRFLATVEELQVGPRLVDFLRSSLQTFTYDQICSKEASSYSAPILHTGWITKLSLALQHHKSGAKDPCFSFDRSTDGQQLCWPLEGLSRYSSDEELRRSAKVN